MTKEKKSPNQTRRHDNYYPRTGTNNGKGNSNKRKMSRRLQAGGFLNRYNFTYAGRDAVNQIGKVSPEIIN